MQTKRVFLCALSNPIEDPAAFGPLWAALENENIEVEPARSLLEPLGAKEKAEEFNRALRSMRYDWIFDLSGGDLANLCLPYIDYEAYANSRTWYAAFSDGTCLVNALAACAHRKAALYPLWEQEEISGVLRLMESGALEPKIVSLNKARFNRHTPVYGGNMRCLMKLSATGRMPQMSGAYLFLESYSARWQQFASLAAQMKQTGLLDEICGVIFGRFNRLEADACSRGNALRIMEHYMREQLGNADVPFFSADEIGHIPGSDGIWISAGRPRLPHFECEQPASASLSALRHGLIEEDAKSTDDAFAKTDGLPAARAGEDTPSKRATLEGLIENSASQSDPLEKKDACPTRQDGDRLPEQHERLFQMLPSPLKAEKEAAKKDGSTHNPNKENESPAAGQSAPVSKPLVRASVPRSLLQAQPAETYAGKPCSAPVTSSPEQAAHVPDEQELALRAARFANSFNTPEMKKRAGGVRSGVSVQTSARHPFKAAPSRVQSRPKTARRAAPGKQNRPLRKTEKLLHPGEKKTD